jgi:hypothetical protein
MPDFDAYTPKVVLLYKSAQYGADISGYYPMFFGCHLLYNLPTGEFKKSLFRLQCNRSEMN